ncbi:hypothetical protein EXIGLDRAFT_720733 [Exidia glandulosa HHB12029]|uniref:Uncharacterized protein n=1 Tax=Exidia glandulosa HHB12029 TaxID=1314781 RepID=A0A165G6W2_EXIGL|nr:hypothetical protein EXIGLDRAFT_720733 [Exidia glandulosa HHB12029]
MHKIISIIVAVLGICVVGLVYFHFLHTLPARPLSFLLLIALLLQVTSAYRLESVLGDLGAKNHVAFWLASALPEWYVLPRRLNSHDFCGPFVFRLVTAAYFAINLNSLIPGTMRQEPEKRGAGSHDTHPNSAA